MTQDRPFTTPEGEPPYGTPPLGTQDTVSAPHGVVDTQPRAVGRRVVLGGSLILAAGAVYALTRGGEDVAVQPPNSLPRPEESSISVPEVEPTLHPPARFALPGDRAAHYKSRGMFIEYNPTIVGVRTIEEMTGRPLPDGVMVVPTKPANISEVTTDPDNDLGWMPAFTDQIRAAGFVGANGTNVITVVQPANRNINNELGNPEVDAATVAWYQSWGITADEGGVFVVGGEPLVGDWEGIGKQTAVQYAEMVEHQVGLLDTAIPGASISTMLDAKELARVLPHLKDENDVLRIDTSRLAAQGYQVFPGPNEDYRFKRDADGKLYVSNHEQMFPADNILAAAETLGLDLPTWLNVGVGDAHHTDQQRQAIAEMIVSKVRELQDKGVTVPIVNLYLADLSAQGKKNFAPTSTAVAKTMLWLADELAATDVAISVAASKEAA